MTYSYEDYRQNVFTPEGLEKVLKIIDLIHETDQRFLYMEDLIRPLSGDTWSSLACVDYLLEIKRLKEIEYKSPAQYRLFKIL